MAGFADASIECKLTSVLIDEGVKVNSQVYLNMLQEKVLRWLTKTFQNIYIFTHEDGVAYTAKMSQE